jgi:hypothetical protein
MTPPIPAINPEKVFIIDDANLDSARSDSSKRTKTAF